jgi:hypothetical protein
VYLLVSSPIRRERPLELALGELTRRFLAGATAEEALAPDNVVIYNHRSLPKELLQKFSI